MRQITGVSISCHPCRNCFADFLVSFTTIASNMTTKRTNLPSIEDQFCIGTVCKYFIPLPLEFDFGNKILSRECLIPAHGRIQLVATGYIWFTYSTPVSILFFWCIVSLTNCIPVEDTTGKA